MGCSPPGSSVHGIFQARILEWLAMPSSRASSWPMGQTCICHVTCIGRWVFYKNSWWMSRKESTCQSRRWGLDSWVGKIPWRRKWQPTPASLPGKSHGQRILAGYSPWGQKRTETNLATEQPPPTSLSRYRTSPSSQKVPSWSLE